jgi:hypothetical protein
MLTVPCLLPQTVMGVRQFCGSLLHAVFQLRLLLVSPMVS